LSGTEGIPLVSGRARVPAHLTPLFQALNASPDPIFATDRQNRIVFWNEKAQLLLGHEVGEAMGASCAEILQGCDVFDNRYCTEHCAVVQIASRGETVRHFDLRLATRDRGTVLVDVTVLHIPLGEPGRFLLVHVMRPSGREDEARAAAAPPRTTLEAARVSPDARARRLSPREVEVLGMMAAGHPTPAIAARLHISHLTARNHIQNILDKLEVHSKTEAVAFAFQKHLL
jgi:PAS domain S-box-containing protein